MIVLDDKRNNKTMMIFPCRSDATTISTDCSAAISNCKIEHMLLLTPEEYARKEKERTLRQIEPSLATLFNNRHQILFSGEVEMAKEDVKCYGVGQHNNRR